MDLQMIFYIIFTALIISLPVNFIKMGMTEPEYLFIAWLFYTSLIFLYSHLLKSFNVAYIYSFLNILSVLFVAIISVYMFDSNISFFTSLGIFFSIVAIIMFIIDNYLTSI